MEKAQISNPRFELISSSIKDYKEVQVIFDYQGKSRKYFVFVKEGKNVNYINEAKKKFEQEVNSGKVAKMLKHTGKGIARPWFIATASALGVAAITFASLFTWKMLTNPGTDEPEPEPEPVVDKWYLDQDFLDSLTKDDVGIIRKLEVNGVEHRVRLIGIDHDTLSNDSNKKAHTTWEFADLISDRNGFSLTTFWNDVESENPSIYPHTYIPCGNYFDSSIRYALVGKYDDVEPSHGWYEKKGIKKSKIYTKPVIDMLPSDLVEKIKPVEKKVTIYDSNNPGDPIVETCDDKLFILSFQELGSPDYKVADVGTQYDYYEGAGTGNTTDLRRIKRQIKYKEEQGAVLEATNIEDGKRTTGAHDNIAGYNSYTVVSGTPMLGGSGYWLRDYSITDQKPHGASSGANVCATARDANELAAPIAPAFCL